MPAQTFPRRFMRALLLAFFLFCFCGFGSASAKGLDVHFLDIGRNDGILIVCGGEAAFIDGGMNHDAEIAINYLDNLGIRRLKYYIGTHAHNDHVGGGAQIIERYNVSTVLQPHSGVKNMIIDKALSDTAEEAAENASYVTVSPGRTFYVGGARLTVLGPLAVHNVSPSDKRENRNSLVLRLSYGRKSFLLTGDATAGSLLSLEEAHPGTLDCDVYKNAHHNTEPSSAVLAAASPKYVVFSTDRNALPSESMLKKVSASGATSLVTASNWNGTVILHTDGSSLSLATQNSGVSSVSFKSSAVSVYEGKSVSLSLSSRPSRYKYTMVLSSSNKKVATVNANGRVTGIKPGTVTITARGPDGVSAECTVTVLPVSLTLNKSALSVKVGKTASLSARIRPSGTKGLSVEWSSDDPSIASVSGKGKVTGGKVGKTTIRAELPNGQTASCTVTVLPVEVSRVTIKPSSVTVTIGDRKQLTGSVSPKNASYPDLTWSSADESIVRVSSKGLLTAVGVGKTKVTATASNGKSRSVTVRVRPVYVKSISVSAPKVTLTCGVKGKDTVQLAAAVLPADASIRDVRWKSSSTRVAVVDEDGRVTAVGTGKATIYAYATDGSGRRASLKITVLENRFDRDQALARAGRVVYSAKQLRYYKNTLKITLYCANMTAEKVPLPAAGTLRLTLPNGKKTSPATVSEGKSTVRAGSVKTFTVSVPLAQHPALAGLDLSKCDATLIPFDR